MVLALIVGSTLGAVLGLLVGDVGAPGARDLLILPLAILRALYVLLPYILLTLSFAIIGRSVLVGLAGGLLYLVFEVGFRSEERRVGKECRSWVSRYAQTKSG